MALTTYKQTVTSNLTGCPIHVDGKDTGQLTPTDFSIGTGPISTHITPGIHTITLYRTGYKTGTLTVTVPSTTNQRTLIAMNPLPEAISKPPTTHYVTIRANVPSARIFVDDVYTRHYAPEKYKIGHGDPASHISPGKRVIRLERANYTTAEKTITIPTNADFDVHLQLFIQKPLPPTAAPTRYVTITANVSSARIFVDNLYTRHYAPEKYKIGAGDPASYISPGQRVIKLERANYTTVQKTLNIPTNADIDIHFELFKEDIPPEEEPPEDKPPTALLKVRSNPSRADIFIDGKDTGKRTYNSFKVVTTTATYPDDDVTIGRHTITLKLTDYKDASKTVTVKPYDDVEIELDLQLLVAPEEEPPAYTATITANVQNARIYVDNTYTNHYAPETYQIGTGRPHTHISPGQRTIQLEKSGYNPLEKTVTIRPGADTTIHFDLVATTPPEEPPSGEPLPLDLAGLDALIERGEHVLDALDQYLQRVKELQS